MYWQELAAKTKDLPPLEHPWAQIIENTLLVDQPDLHTELFQLGELESYLRVKVADAIAEFDRLVAAGTPPATANELAIQNVLPASEEEPAEDWEIEGGMDDQVDALSDFLENG
jgi:hypothetical protein